MPYEKYIKYAITAVVVIAALLLLPIVVKLFLPFILAFAVASPCQRLLNFLNKRLKINRGLSSAFIVTALVALFSWIIVILCSQLFQQIKAFVEQIPETVELIKVTFNSLANKFDEYLLAFSPELKSFFENLSTQFSDSLIDAVSPLTNTAISAAKRFAISLPDIVVFFFMFLLSTFFITKDYSLLINFFKENCPEKIRIKLNSFKSTAFSAFFTYIKAQLILMCITASIVTIALWFLGTDYPFVMGIIIGFVDALPFFGTAIIIIPWAIMSFFNGNYFFACGLLIIQVVAFVTRQLLEPKIISSQIGLHPLITLISLYLGLNLFGIGGIIIGPITALFIVNAYVAAKTSKDDV